MSGVPVETVVELLMEQASVIQDGTTILKVGGKWITAANPNEMRKQLREYVETLAVGGKAPCNQDETDQYA